MSKYILVTGPAASGKTTLASSLCEDKKFFFYKPSQAYMDIAREKQIPKERIFYDIDQVEINGKIISICRSHNLIVGDQHLAIQHKRDSAIATGDYSSIDPTEPYVAALDYSLIESILNEDIKIQLIYLRATAKMLYERAVKRHQETGFVLRNNSIEETQAEIDAEEHFFNELIKLFQLPTSIIDTDDKTKEEIKKLSLKRIGD